MKVLIGAALAAAVMVTAAVAQETTTPAPAPTPQPTACAPLPEEPARPDGATATREEMQAGATAYEAWAESYRQAVACRRAEVAQTRATYDALLAAHNEAANYLNAAIASWQAEADEFNARAPSSRRGR